MISIIVWHHICALLKNLSISPPSIPKFVTIVLSPYSQVSIPKYKNHKDLGLGILLANQLGCNMWLSSRKLFILDLLLDLGH